MTLKYNLRRYSDRLRAIADGRTLSNTHGYGSPITLCNMHQHMAALMDNDGNWQLKPRTSVRIEDYDDACEKLGLGGVFVDDLRQLLFDVPCGYEKKLDAVLSGLKGQGLTPASYASQPQAGESFLRGRGPC